MHTHKLEGNVAKNRDYYEYSKDAKKDLLPRL